MKEEMLFPQEEVIGKSSSMPRLSGNCEGSTLLFKCHFLAHEGTMVLSLSFLPCPVHNILACIVYHEDRDLLRAVGIFIFSLLCEYLNFFKLKPSEWISNSNVPISGLSRSVQTKLQCCLNQFVIMSYCSSKVKL